MRQFSRRGLSAAMKLILSFFYKDREIVEDALRQLEEMDREVEALGAEIVRLGKGLAGVRRLLQFSLLVTASFVGPSLVCYRLANRTRVAVFPHTGRCE